MIVTENFKQVLIESTEALRTWLEAHHSQPESVWLVTYKKAVTGKYVSRQAVLDELISFGWIDGIRRRLDDQKTMQLISPRKSQHWAQSYKIRAEQLIATGRMHRAGQKAIDQSKEKGLWNFMDDVDRLEVPDDLACALKESPKAKDFFDGINPSSKRFVLRWIKLAKTEKTRRNRISKIVSLSFKGEKLPGS